MGSSRWLGALLGLVVALGACLAHGQTFPSKPLKLVVPFPPGGATDVLGRIVAQHLGATLGQPVIVENKSGAGSALGAEMVAKSAPDGYTLLIGSPSTFSINPVLNPKLPYDPLKSFAPVSMVTTIAMVLVAHPSVQASNFGELTALVGPKPGQYTFGSFGNGSSAHFAGELLNSMAGIKMTHVPYKGSAPAMNDLVGGQIQLMIDTVVAAQPQLKAGRIKAIAVTTGTRSTMMPDVPTIAESGLPSFQFQTWNALVAPAGTPEAARTRLRSDMSKLLDSSSVREKLVQIGFEPFNAGPDEYVRIVREEIERFSRVAREANIRSD